MSPLPTTVHVSPLGALNNAGRRRQRPQPIALVRGVAQGLEHTDDRALDSVQRRVADASASARALPLAGANIIYGLTLASGTPLIVQHGLGRAFTSCFLCGQSATGSIAVQRPSAIRRPMTPQNVLDQRQITVTPNFSGTADLMVW